VPDVTDGLVRCYILVPIHTNNNNNKCQVATVKKTCCDSTRGKEKSVVRYLLFASRYGRGDVSFDLIIFSNMENRLDFCLEFFILITANK
jgi:hypothetical protein